MDFMVCLSGAPKERAMLPELARLGCGIELQSYGLVGIRSEAAWDERRRLHAELARGFTGALAVHGPFIGMQFQHDDHLFNDVITRRMDMTFDAVRALGAKTLVLHTGYNGDLMLLRLGGLWLERSAAYWSREIVRWQAAGVRVALENLIEPTPELMVELIDRVNNPSLGLCFDTGHGRLYGRLSLEKWVEAMGPRLFHVHAHDNLGEKDDHFGIGQGTIDFAPFVRALHTHAPRATISLETTLEPAEQLENLRAVMKAWAPGA